MTISPEVKSAIFLNKIAQEFPLTTEVGNAILKYLRKVPPDVLRGAHLLRFRDSRMLDHFDITCDTCKVQIIILF